MQMLQQPPVGQDSPPTDAIDEREATTLFDVFNFVRPLLDVRSRRSFRLCSTASQTAHDREESGICACSGIKTAAPGPDQGVAVAETRTSLSGILARGCRPDSLVMRLDVLDPDAQARGTAALACFTANGVTSISRLTAYHFHLTSAAATAAAAAAPALTELHLHDCRLDHVTPLLTPPRVQDTLRQLSLERCSAWPPSLGSALQSCSGLEGLTLLYESASDADTGNTDGDAAVAGRGGGAGDGGDAGGGGGSSCSASLRHAREVLRACRALTTLTQLRCLNFDLRLPSDHGDGDQPLYRAPVPDGSVPGAADDDGSRARAHVRATAAASLASGFSSLTRLSCLEIGESGAVPHPGWRLDFLRSVASLPGLKDLSWRRLECDAAALSALAMATALTSLSVEKFREPAPLAAVALAATAAAAAMAVPQEATEQPSIGSATGGNADPRRAAAVAAAARAAAAAAAAALSYIEGSEAADDSGVPSQPIWRRLLLPLPPNLRLLRARYSGLGGMSLASLAALQLPSASTTLELRNPKLEVGDLDVQQPAGARLLPVAALALGLGLSKLATHGSGLHTLRIINESRQRNALAAPPGWAEGSGGGVGAAGGGHVPWLTQLGSLRGLRRLTLSGFMLGRVDAEALARQLAGLEELYLVPLSSVSSAAVPVLRGMGLKRLVLPYERHA